jgi:hypothetical protein
MRKLRRIMAALMIGAAIVTGTAATPRPAAAQAGPGSDTRQVVDWIPIEGGFIVVYDDGSFDIIFFDCPECFFY